jgi:hypothetical protein
LNNFFNMSRCVSIRKKREREKKKTDESNFFSFVLLSYCLRQLKISTRYIPLEKISFLRYFDDIITKIAYFLKLITYSESPWSSLSPSIYSCSFLLIYYHKIWVQWRHPHVHISTELIFSCSSKLIFKIFHHYRIIFLKKQL